MTSTKLTAGAAFPDIPWPAVGGDQLEISKGEGWRLLVVYRGQHCPLCKGYLKTLNDLAGAFDAAKITVVALSADSREKALADVEQFGWTFPVGYGLTVNQMRELGLYVSSPRSASESDHLFSEPGLFVINPQGLTQIVDVSNAPFARPDLKALLAGLQFVIANAYPIRGTA
jgi:peroxiredoxin